MWQSRTKDDLIIEVWEKLDCESVGAVEIEAIETVVADIFGRAAVDSPMVMARLLADEGAELRHSEIMRLYIERNSDLPYEAAFRNILQLSDLRSALGTLRSLENLRRKYKSENDKEGLRLVRETALRGKRGVNEIAEKRGVDGMTRQVNIEISQWISVWLQTPEMFADWVELRQRSAEFVERFGRIRPEDNA
jgi:hypothetical protein